MNNTSAPVFRKSMSGYNKEDVNAYILELSDRLKDAEQNVDMLAVQNTQMSSQIEELQRESAKVPELIATIEKLTAQLEKCSVDLANAENINGELKTRAEDAENRAKAASAEYDSICRSAGQIFALAGNTAEEILKRADNEAHKIVDEANNTKKNVFKSISETTEDFTSDLSDYIKGAINDCIKKINDTAAAYTPRSDEASKPAVTFINND